MSTSTVPAVLDALVDSLNADPELTSLPVFSAPAGDSAPFEHMEFGAEFDLAENPFAMGGVREESYELDGKLVAAAPGAGEASIRVVRDRAFGFLAAVEACLNDDPTLGGVCIAAEMTALNVKQAPAGEGRACAIEITVSVTALKTP